MSALDDALHLLATECSRSVRLESMGGYKDRHILLDNARSDLAQLRTDLVHLEEKNKALNALLDKRSLEARS